MITAPGEDPLAMFCGRLNTPPSIIEPTTSATNGHNPSLSELRSAAAEFDWDFVNDRNLAFDNHK
jgi:hypothetical protein